MNSQNLALQYLNELKLLFTDWATEDILSFDSLPESGSVRKYYRITSKSKRAVGSYNPDKKENVAFKYLSKHLIKAGVNVPEIYADDIDNDIYLLEDLGDVMLYNYYNENIENKEALINIYKSVIREMPKLQVNAANGLDFSVCYPRAEFDRQSMLWDLHYFKSYFLKLTAVKFYEQDLEDDFNTLTNFLLQAKRDYFLFRDFQSRNIMLHNGKIFFIDYQGGRKGALQYDIASLLFESKINLPSALRDELLDYYIEIFSYVRSFDKIEFLKYYYGYVLIRMLQALGAYGFRGYFERKHFFLQSIPPAVNILKWLIENMNLEINIPQLMQCFEQIVRSDFAGEYEEPKEGLTVSINSFSYKNGIPMDNTGNGGGFVFDCRALPNPGRYEKYKTYTGKDYPVIEFLKDKPEVNNFIENVYSIIVASIKNYSERHFSNLMINFGCTGGQHRSVFCAEEICRRIQQNFDVTVNIRHRQMEKQK